MSEQIVNFHCEHCGETREVNVLDSFEYSRIKTHRCNEGDRALRFLMRIRKVNQRKRDG